MNKERIEFLIEKGALTMGEKREIERAADELGLSYTINNGCRECYDKLLLRLYEFEAPQPNLSVDGYRLRNTTANITIGGKVVNNATIKDIEVGKFSKRIIYKYFLSNEDRDRLRAEMGRGCLFLQQKSAGAGKGDGGGWGK